ncbi:MAG: hypothetical protein ACFFG0_00110 [Candidatus Thorarchaeota archaeon]
MQSEIKYPCNECLVDVICEKSCDLLNMFFEDLDRNYDYDLFEEACSNDTRLYRSLEAVARSEISSSLYLSIVKQSFGKFSYNYKRKIK